MKTYKIIYDLLTKNGKVVKEILSPASTLEYFIKDLKKNPFISNIKVDITFDDLEIIKPKEIFYFFDQKKDAYLGINMHYLILLKGTKYCYSRNNINPYVPTGGRKTLKALIDINFDELINFKNYILSYDNISIVKR